VRFYVRLILALFRHEDCISLLLRVKLMTEGIDGEG
jgi:hypothetical protein